MTVLGSSVIICLGANLPSQFGPPAATLRRALAHLSRIGLHVTAVSRFFLTPCFTADAGPDYVNAACVANTLLSPMDLLAALHKVESKFGRTRHTRWAQRTLDLDLIAYDQMILPNIDTFHRWADLALDHQQISAPDRLILPHPRLQDRAFVLIPLLDIARDWQHPVTKHSVSDMAAALPAADRALVRPI
ncbi:MAG: 2-amino-4-hydroxy-6-hydroxymethyldihydropteridine diphosphokinase [Pseudomonadota bacterium]